MVDYSFISRVEMSEQYDLTDAEMEVIKAGEIDLADVQRAIRGAARQ
jgi:hypothetical protein